MGHIPLYANGDMHVEFGDVCCSIKCHDTQVFSNLKELYQDFLSDSPADIGIELEAVDGLNMAEANEVYQRTRITTWDDHFRAAELSFEGEFDTTNRIFRVSVEKCLLDPNSEIKLMNRLFPVVYFTACREKYRHRPPPMLVHSCGIIRHGQVLAFAGPCETGKTTIARMCGEKYGQVLNDEMLLFSQSQENDGTLQVHGVPILGGIAQRLNATGPLNCVLLLKQSHRTEVNHLNRTEAYLRFMRQVISPAYFGQTDRRAVLSQIAEFSDEVTRKTPFYELEFTLDPIALWDVVEELEQSLKRKGGA